MEGQASDTTLDERDKPLKTSSPHSTTSAGLSTSLGKSNASGSSPSEGTEEGITPSPEPEDLILQRIHSDSTPAVSESTTTCPSAAKLPPKKKNPRYKTAMCRNIALTGRCPFEADCVFAHSESELRTKEQNLAEAEAEGEVFAEQRQLLPGEKQKRKNRKRNNAARKQRKWLVKLCEAVQEQEAKTDGGVPSSNEPALLSSILDT